MRETLGEKIFRVIVLAGLSVFVLLPLYVMVATSLKPLGDVQAGFTWFPSRITFEPFVEMWSSVPLARYFMNSLVVNSIAPLLSAGVAPIAAFADTRCRHHRRNAGMTQTLLTLCTIHLST